MKFNSIQIKFIKITHVFDKTHSFFEEIRIWNNIYNLKKISIIKIGIISMALQMALT